MDKQFHLKGNLISLRLSTLEDRRRIYDWFTYSDLTASMAGEPAFPDSPPATWEEFCEDHTDHFFDGDITELGRCFIMQVDGEDVGQLYFNDIETRDGIKRVELDMWMRAEQYCGKGYGSEALTLLCNYLHQQFGVDAFMVQPSARNSRAIHAYTKVGFVRLDVPLETAIAEWGPNDYYDSVYMVKRL